MASAPAAAGLLQRQREFQAGILRAGNWLEMYELWPRLPPDANIFLFMWQWRLGDEVLVVEFERRQFVPSYAFDEHWEPLPALQVIVRMLRWHYSSWQIAGWFESPNSLLDGALPRSLLARDPARVKEAARSQAQRIVDRKRDYTVRAFARAESPNDNDPLAQAPFRTRRPRLRGSLMSAFDEAPALLPAREGMFQAEILHASDWIEMYELWARLPPDADIFILMAQWRGGYRMFIVERHRKQFLPPYAFDEHWEPLPAVHAILQFLWRYSAWQVAGWFESPNSDLDGALPRELLARDPARVERAARRQAQRIVRGNRDYTIGTFAEAATLNDERLLVSTPSPSRRSQAER